MKLTCKRDDLLEGLQTVQNVVSSKATIPILSNVLVEATVEELVLTATDLEMGIRRRVKAKVAKEGAITVPAKRLLGILRELPLSEVSMESTDGRELTIKCDQSYFKILGLPREDFPPLPDFLKNRSVPLTQATLGELIRKTNYAVSHDESRYVLNGIYLILAKGRITAVATDGRRLAMCELPAEIPDGFDCGVIIPTKTALELGRLLGDEGGLELFLGENQIAFNMEECALVSRLVEGHFPNYQQVIPQRCEHKVALDREEVLAAVRRAALLTTEQSNSIRLDLKKGRLIVSANTPEVGEAREEIAIAYSGGEMGIAFNPQFLSDVLKNLVEKEVVLEIIDPLNPGVIRSGKSFLYVIMPIRAN